MHVLKVLSGPEAGRSVPIASRVVIGREEADLAIDDPELSRSHAAVRTDDGGVVLEDLGSLNGTYVDGVRLDAPVTLTPGTTFRVGASEIAVESAKPQRDGRAASRRRPPLPALLAAVVLAVLAGGLVYWLTRGDSTESHTLRATTIAAVASTPAPRMTILGLVRGRPVGEMSAIIIRDVDGLNTPGGPPVNLRLNILFSQPDGSFRAQVVGTVRVTRNGTEVVRGEAEVSDGTGIYDGISGEFTLAGDNPPRTPTSRFTLQGTLEY